jgi:hypothetical protein
MTLTTDLDSVLQELGLNGRGRGKALLLVAEFGSVH